MDSDWKLPVLIFALLAVLIAAPFVFRQVRESRRPILLEARVVTATSTDPVLREGRRHVPPGDSVRAALALRIERNGSDELWLAPGEALFLDGALVDHLNTDQWPDEGRSARVFWFTVESTNLGGELNLSTVDRLRYRSFLAPEMGRDLVAARLPEAHNDDFLGTEGGTAPATAGTFRIYARVEIVENADDVEALQSAVTLDADRIFDPAFPTISRAVDLGPGVDSTSGELFHLPGFEPEGSSPEDWNRITVPAFGAEFTELVDERLVTSSWTLAAVAVSGQADLLPSDLVQHGDIMIGPQGLRSGGRPLEWQRDVRPGDLLRDRRHWMILLQDQGDGLLDPADTVLHSWGRPPVITTLLMAMPEGVSELEHYRHAP
jgi:hypothetical protein